MSKKTRCGALALMAIAANTTSAHEAWVQPGPGPLYPVEYGDFTPEAYPAAKVLELKAVDGNGKAMKSELIAAPYGSYARITGQPSVITLHFDNLLWTKNAAGVSVNLPKAKVPGGTTTSHPVKYGKTILKWDAEAYKPQGQRIEIVPLGSGVPKAHSKFTAQVLFEGKPLADSEVELVGVTPEGNSPHTDADGRITIEITEGLQRLAAPHTLDKPQENGVDSMSVTAALLFVPG